MMALTALILPIVGVMMSLTPYLMRRGEVFAVTVPTAAQGDPYLRALKRRYVAIMGVVTVVLSLAAFAFAAAENAGGVMAIMLVGTFILLGLGYGLMLFFREKTKVYKRERGWVAEAQETVAAVGDQPVPRAISLKWNLLYLPIMIITFAVGAVGYSQMPNMIPLHMSFDGTVDNWTQKTPMVLWMPVLIQAFMAACFVFVHWTITRSKKWMEPGAPATSALAYGMFARAQSIYLVAGGAAMALAIIIMPLSFMNMVSMMQSAMVIIVAALVLCVGAIAVSIVYGQAGSRVFQRMQGSNALLADDDTHWKFGVFYFNPGDASMFLPERFGVGWTVNWARPAVWAIMVAGLVLTVAFVIATMTLF